MSYKNAFNLTTYIYLIHQESCNRRICITQHNKIKKEVLDSCNFIHLTGVKNWLTNCKKVVGEFSVTYFVTDDISKVILITFAPLLVFFCYLFFVRM